MLTINYCKEGTAISDFVLEDWIQSLKPYAANQDQPNKVESISSEIAILAIRVAVKKGELNYKNTILKFGESKIEVDKHGDIEYYPKGFYTALDNLLEQLIDWGKSDTNTNNKQSHQGG